MRLQSIMNIIEIGDNCISKLKWKEMKNITVKVQSKLSSKLSLFQKFSSPDPENDDKDMMKLSHETLCSISLLIHNKNTYWQHIHFNLKGKIKTTDLSILSYKLQCCLILYGNKHPFTRIYAKIQQR